MAGQHGDLAEPKLQMSTSSEWVDGTDAASWAPCEWGRRAASAPVQGWSAIIRTGNVLKLHDILHTTAYISQVMALCLLFMIYKDSVMIFTE